MTGSLFDTVDGRVRALLTDSEIAPGSLAAWATDWEALVAQAEAQRVAQLLYERLRSADRLRELPVPAVARLARDHYRWAYRNLQTLHTLERLLTALAGCTSRVVLLKGAGLLASVYASPALRPLDDVDILILPQELAPALRCVEALGYERERGELFAGAPLSVTPYVEMFRRGYFPERIELHHHWLGVRAELGRHVAMADVCGRAVPVAIGAAEGVAAGAA